MKRHQLVAATGLFAVFSISSVANAALVERLGGLAYYDTEADLTWLANPNYANTTMTWDDAMNWVSTLEVGGVGGWRLPTTPQFDASCSYQSLDYDYGYNCTGSEMGNLYYTALGNAAYSITEFGPFSIQLNNTYWSATVSAAYPDAAFVFDFGYGEQNINGKTYDRYAWAVRTGDVGASVVPVPAAAWLFSSGLLGLIGAARKKRIS